MLTIGQILQTSFQSTSRRPRWWILALLQLGAFSVMGEFTRPRLLKLPYLWWLILAVLLVIIVTVILWQEIEADHNKIVKKISPQLFWQQCLSAGMLVISAIAITIFTRLAYFPWVFLAVISSLVTATAALAMLYVVLCGQKLVPALAMAADTWNKKVSFGALTALVLIAGHGIAFGLVHSIFEGFSPRKQFSVYKHSATIWILLLASAAAMVFFAALLNCLFVYFFLELINRKKDPETVMQPVVAKQPVLEGNS